MDEREEIIFTISVSPVRLWLAIGMLAALAAILLLVAIRMPGGAILWQLMIFAIAGLCIWTGLKMHAASGLRIEMTETAIRDSAGRVLAEFDEIRGVERGALAFKPSNGFLLRTKTPGPRVWVPGVWWRVGRSVGVGGVTPGHEAKAMADQLAIRLAARDRAPV